MPSFAPSFVQPLFHRRALLFFAILATFLLATPMVAESLTVDKDPVDIKPRKLPCHLLDDPETADLLDAIRFGLIDCPNSPVKPPTEEAPPRDDDSEDAGSGDA
ncbi:MAG: hypothetical protein AAGE94_17755 [Acidobacteriota bacterium]